MSESALKKAASRSRGADEETPTNQQKKKKAPAAEESVEDSNKAASKTAVASSKPEQIVEPDVLIEDENSEIVSSPAEWVPAETDEEAEDRIIRNMTIIAQGLKDYADNRKAFPGSAMSDNSKNPTLSWRVAILPYIGYEDLYNRFNVDESWESPDNYKLLDEIPDVYRLPKESNNLTPFLVPIASEGIFHGYIRSLRMNDVEDSDGVADTLMLLEVSRDKAIPWTKPADLEVERENAAQMILANSGENGCFVAWANGHVTRLKPSATPDQVWFAVTATMGDQFKRSEIVEYVRVKEDEEELINPFVDDIATVGDGTHATVEQAVVEPEVSIEEQLEKELLAKATSSLVSGRDTLAFDYCYTAALIQQPKVAVTKYQWVSGLERPAFGLKFGVGIVVSDEDEKEGTQVVEATSEWLGGLPGESQFAEITGEAGMRVLRAVREFQNSGAAGEFVESGGVLNYEVTTALDSLRYSPGVYLLGWGTHRVMRGVAQREALDVLVLIEIEVDRKSSNTSTNRRTRRNQSREKKEAVDSVLKISFSDAKSGAELFQLREIRSSHVKEKREDRLADDPLDYLTEQLETYLSNELSLRPSNQDELTPEFARKRLDQLATDEYKTPIPAFAEIQYYFGKGLVSEVEVKEAFAKLSDEESEILLLGRADDRYKYLSQWLEDTDSDNAAKQKNTRRGTDD